MAIEIDLDQLTEQGKENFHNWSEKGHFTDEKEQLKEEIGKTLTQEPEPEITGSIDTPADVLEFRRGFVNGIEKTDDVTQEKLEKIVEIGEKLVREPKEGKSFHFEETAYGEMGVLKLGGKTMKFLNIAHPQDFNNELTHKIKDESLINIDLTSGGCKCRCKNTQDFVYNGAMPDGGPAEDMGIKELIDKIKESTGLGQISGNAIKNNVYKKLRNYCNKNKIFFKDSTMYFEKIDTSTDYMLLYMYLMGPNGGFGQLWLSDNERISRSSYDEHFVRHCCKFTSSFRSPDSHDWHGNPFASLFFGSFA